MTKKADFLPRNHCQSLLDALHKAGYQVIGPQVRDGAIVYDSINYFDQLPHGFQDDQAPGHYRLIANPNPRCFTWANGPQAIKPFLFTPQEQLWHVDRDEEGKIRFQPTLPGVEKKAIIGVRACDLAALRLQDQHFVEGQISDPAYSQRREELFLVAVNCTHPAATCFCASTGDGPEATHSYDLALSELDDGYLIQSGSDAGNEIMAQLPLSSATTQQIEQTQQEITQSAEQQQRQLPSPHLQDALFANLDHPRWQDIADRCLSCSNCTSVCPTCFCYSETDHAALDGTNSQHYREWDSCFNRGHSTIHGATLREDTRLRYRQWLTHKLGSWHEQYGRSGCVGCGRCITWCPVGIDITEEATVICGKQS